MKQSNPPRSNSVVVGIVTLGTAFLFVVLNAPLPVSLAHSRVMGALENGLHGLLFAGVAGLARWLLSGNSWRSYLYSWLIAAGLALGTEISQFLSSRDPSWEDVRTDIFGATVALAVWGIFSRCRTETSRFRRVVLASLGCLTMAPLLAPVVLPISILLERSQRFPVLFDATFSSVMDMTESMTEDEDVAIFVRDGALQVHLLNGPLPGVVVTDFASDWRGYQALVVDVENPGILPLKLEVHLRDFGSSDDNVDRFNASATLPPGQRVSLRFPLTVIVSAPHGRKMRLDSMSIIALDRTATGSAQFSLHSIRLE